MPVRSQTLRTLVMQLPIDPDLDVPFERHDRRLAVLLVAAGGAVGSVARAAVGIATPVASHGWPTATLSVNVFGSALLAILLALLHERAVTAWWTRPLLGTGFCGGFTTFSTYAVEFSTRAQDARIALALGYAEASVVLSLAAALLGIVIVRVGVRLADRSAWHRRLSHVAERAVDKEST
jgi:fluoride exporter